MAYKRLFIWVEGPDDQRFFNRIVKPLFERGYDWVEVRMYAYESSEYLTKFIKSIKAMKADYILVSDINSASCITQRKQRLSQIFKHLDQDSITIVIQEIESWYVAGLDRSNSKKLGLPFFEVTDEIKKEKLNQLIPKKFDSRIDFMTEILKCFSIDIAKQKNSSFKYFVEKYQQRG